MIITKVKSLFLFLLFVPIHNCYAIEDVWSRDRIYEESKNSYLKMDFKRLEELSNKFRTEKSMVASGTWKLTIFHAGVWDGVENGKDLYQESTWVENEKITSAWIKRYPHSPAAHITYAKILSAHGWAFRGGDFSDAVPKSAWAPFYKYQELAYQELIKNKKLSSADPTWYGQMLMITKCLGLKKNDLYKLFLEGTDKEPYFYETYFQFADVLLPKWYGSREMLEEFANEAVQKTKISDGNIAYARIYMHVYHDFNDIFHDSNVSWPKLKLGFDELIKKYPDKWNINVYAKFACKAGDFKAMTPLIKTIESNPNLEAWDDSSEFYLRCKVRSLL